MIQQQEKRKEESHKKTTCFVLCRRDLGIQVGSSRSLNVFLLCEEYHEFGRCQVDSSRRLTQRFWSSQVGSSRSLTQKGEHDSLVEDMQIGIVVR